MSKPTKEDVQAAVEAKVDEAKTGIEAQAKTNVWPLLAGALVIGAVIGGVAVWLLG